MALKKNAEYHKALVFFVIILFLNISIFKTILGENSRDSESVMGGSLYIENYEKYEEYTEELIQPDDQYIERYLRPSNAKALDKKYLFNKEDGGIPKKFSISSEVVRAYFDILSDASNMENMKSGCGSIGFGMEPYPVAYSLLSQKYQEELPYDKFLKSFEGIGHINLLKLIEVPAIKKDDKVCPRLFVEIETIEGSEKAGKTYFAYYYGYVTVEQQGDMGWKISNVELTSEDFLCHAYHGWWHDASSVVQILYGQKCGIIEKILGTEENGDIKNVIAKGRDGKQYRFNFVRITNGADIELRQYVMSDGKWKDIQIDVSKYMKEN